MWTRGLVGHIIRGQKRAAYSRSGSYPTALGSELVRFITSLTDEQIRQMIEKLDTIEWVDETSTPPEDLKTRYVAARISDPEADIWCIAFWYILLLKAEGAAAQPLILDGSLGHLIDKTDFEKDRLHCEWTYFIDWEKKQMVVRGWNETKKTFGFDELSEAAMEDLERVARRKGESEECDYRT